MPIKAVKKGLLKDEPKDIGRDRLKKLFRSLIFAKTKAKNKGKQFEVINVNERRQLAELEKEIF